MSDIQRYTLDAGFDGQVQADPDPEGEWCLFSEVERAVQDRGADPLREAAEAVVYVWDHPKERLSGGMAEVRVAIDALRAALGEEPNGQ